MVERRPSRSILLEARAAGPDPLGEVRSIIDRPRHRIDVRALHQLGKRQVAGKVSVTVENLRAAAVEQNPPVVHRAAGGKLSGGGHLGKDVGGAVVGDRVVPLRVLAQFVGVVEIFQKEFARPLRSGGGVKQVNIFASSIVGTQPDKIAFIGENVKQFILPEKSANRGIALAHLVPGFDGGGNVVIVAKLEAHDGMRDPGRTPVGHEHIDAAKLAQKNSFGKPLAGVVELGTIIAVAKIMNGNLVAINFGPRSLGIVGLPVAIVRRL